MSEMADTNEVDASEADASEADDEYISETDDTEADPCNSDYDYNYDTLDECEDDIILDEGARNYRELLLFEEIYKNEEQQSAKRDEFIYTRVFNNHNIIMEVMIDFNLGTMEDWSKTCDKFNRGEMSLDFARIDIIIYNSGPYNCVTLSCNNIHPFAQRNKQEDEMSRLSSLMYNTAF